MQDLLSRTVSLGLTSAGLAKSLGLRTLRWTTEK